ncbi:hypothetical protein GF345_02805 [Candidatus Woesearchaeota archaeon]|nr:hypothetical protein [Candidatus Woesearchaeota archaeon]
MGSQKTPRFMIYLLVLLFLFPSVLSADYSITLKDVNTKDTIKDLFLLIEHDGNDTNKFVGTGSFDLEIPERSRVTLKGDNISTLGKDYYRKTDIYQNTVVYMFPAGTMTGMVKDSLDNVVGSADLKFECSKDIGKEFPSQTDRFGSFTVEYAPTGMCRIYASYHDGMGFTETNIEHGSIADIEINLDRSIVSQRRGINWILVLSISLILLIAVVLLVIGLTVYFKREGKTESGHYTSDKSGRRSRDIIATLDDKEKKVTEFIMEHDNHTMQSRIRHALSIPRTTLSRVVTSLERKKIIEVEKQGKTVKIRLTNWFLGKE